MTDRRDGNWIAARAQAIGISVGDMATATVQDAVALLTSVMHSDLNGFERHLLDIIERQGKIEGALAALAAQVAELLARDRARAAELEALRVGAEIERAVTDGPR